MLHAMLGGRPLSAQGPHNLSMAVCNSYVTTMHYQHTRFKHARKTGSPKSLSNASSPSGTCMSCCRFAFPALKPPEPFRSLSAQPLTAVFPSLLHQICEAADAWRNTSKTSGQQDTLCPEASPTLGAEVHAEVPVSACHHPDMFGLLMVDAATGTVTTAALSDWESLQAGGLQSSKMDQESTATATAAVASSPEVLLLMFDPSSEPLTPGWPLRNMLLLAAVRWGVCRLRVLCIRDSKAGRAKPERSFVLEVT